MLKRAASHYLSIKHGCLSRGNLYALASIQERTTVLPCAYVLKGRWAQFNQTLRMHASLLKEASWLFYRDYGEHRAHVQARLKEAVSAVSSVCGFDPLSIVILVLQTNTHSRIDNSCISQAVLLQ